MGEPSASAMPTWSPKAISDRDEVKLGKLLIGMRSIRITSLNDDTGVGLGIPEADSITNGGLVAAVRAAYQIESLGRYTIHGPWQQCHLL